MKLPFIYGRQLLGTNSDLYFLPRPRLILEDISNTSKNTKSTEENTSAIIIPYKIANLIFYINKATGI